MCPGFDSWTRRHMWVEFVVGSLPCSEGFSPGSPVFLPPQKSSFLNSNSIWNSRATGLSVSDCYVLPSLNKVDYYYYYYYTRSHFLCVTCACSQATMGMLHWSLGLTSMFASNTSIAAVHISKTKPYMHGLRVFSRKEDTYSLILVSL